MAGPLSCANGKNHLSDQKTDRAAFAPRPAIFTPRAINAGLLLTKQAFYRLQ